MLFVPAYAVRQKWVCCYINGPVTIKSVPVYSKIGPVIVQMGLLKINCISVRKKWACCYVKCKWACNNNISVPVYGKSGPAIVKVGLLQNYMYQCTPKVGLLQYNLYHCNPKSGLLLLKWVCYKIICTSVCQKWACYCTNGLVRIIFVPTYTKCGHVVVQMGLLQ